MSAAVFLTQYDIALTPHESTKSILEEFTWQHSHSVTEASTGTRKFMVFKMWTEIRLLFSRSLEFFDPCIYKLFTRYDVTWITSEEKVRDDDIITVLALAQTLWRSEEVLEWLHCATQNLWLSTHTRSNSQSQNHKRQIKYALSNDNSDDSNSIIETTMIMIMKWVTEKVERLLIKLM
jgi:hypothetical protein